MMNNLETYLLALEPYLLVEFFTLPVWAWILIVVGSVTSFFVEMKKLKQARLKAAMEPVKPAFDTSEAEVNHTTLRANKNNNQWNATERN